MTGKLTGCRRYRRWLADERWATDLCRVWAGRDGWANLALVIDCHTRELLGWHLSRSGNAQTAESALEQALIARYGCLGRVPKPFYNHQRPHQALGMKTPAEAYALAA